MKRIARIQTCPSWVRVTFADGAVVDVGHAARPYRDRPKDDTERAEHAALDAAFFAAVARQCRVCHSKEAREVRAIVAAAERLAGRCDAVVRVLQAGASEACDGLRSETKLTGRTIGDNRMTKADQVAEFYAVMHRLAGQMRSRAYDLQHRLPVVAGLDPATAYIGGRLSRIVGDHTTFHPAGAKLPAMERGVSGDLDITGANELPADPVAPKVKPRKRAGKAAKPKAGPTPAKAKAEPIVPLAISERMKTNLNGHAIANGVH